MAPESICADPATFVDLVADFLRQVQARARNDNFSARAHNGFRRFSDENRGVTLNSTPLPGMVAANGAWMRTPPS